MTTKEQERKALEQIKKIIAGLGEGSYIATAMDGMIEDAEENIENDFAMSWKDRAITAEKRFQDLQLEYNEQIAGLQESKRIAESERDLAKHTMKQEAERANKGWARVKELKAQLDEAVDEMCKAHTEVAGVELKLNEKEDEIIRLKAKLYDLMVK